VAGLGDRLCLEASEQSCPGIDCRALVRAGRRTPQWMAGKLSDTIDRSKEK